MKFLDVIKTSASNLWRNKGRTFLTVIAIFIGAFTIALTSAVNAGVNDYISRQLSVFGDSSIVYFQPKQEQNVSFGPQEYQEGQTSSSDNSRYNNLKMLTSKDLEKISNIENIENAQFYRVANPDYIQYQDGKKFTITSFVVEIEGHNFDLDFIAGKKAQNKGEISISQDYLESMGFKNAEEAIGKEVKFQFSDALTRETKIFTQKITGVTSKSLIQSAMVFVSESSFNEMYNFQNQSMPAEAKNQSIAAMAKLNNFSKENLDKVKREAEKLGYSAYTVQDQVESIMNVVNAITGSLILFGAIALLAASFGIINTLYMSVRERTREIGLMKAMGLSNGKIFQLFSFEAILIGVIGSILGILAAIAVGAMLNNFAAESFLKGLEGFELTKFTLQHNLIITTVIALVAFLAGTLPSRSASRKDPIEALRYE
ncbi:MAG: FtsX-like permease family protein [bacterium]|nr:FtsX-like permease family protein [bacterium]